MDRISVLAFTGIGLLLIMSGVSAFSLSPVTIAPAGTLNPGDAVNISFTVYAASGTAFPSYDDLQVTTTLDDRTWTYSILVNTVENERPAEITRTLTISGFELSYEDKDEVLVKIALKGKIPATAAVGATKNLVTVQELDARGYAINSTVITIDHLIGTPTPTPTPAIGSISVVSDPAGANIYLDNVYKGFAPLTLDAIPNGDHTVVARLDGYAEVSRKIRITGNSQTVRTVLTPVTTPTPAVTSTRTPSGSATTQAGKATSGETGSLTISTTPPGATVYVDGEMKGNTPATIPGLPSGKHTVQLILAGYSTLNTTISIEAGTTTVYSTGLVQPTKTPGFGAICAVLSFLGILALRKVL